jgi:Sulphur oxidation protein SoxZ
VSTLGEVKIRVPAAIARGSVARARALVIHPNERVERQAGKPVDRNYRFVNRVVVSYAGRDIAEFDTATSIGENPSFGFAFRVTEPATLKVTFFDTHGGRFEGAVQVKLA